MNIIYVMMGPPGVGKTTIITELKKCGVPVMISHTTRKPKVHEQDGVDYWFISNEEYGKMKFIERVNYSGNYYGLHKDELLKNVKINSITVIEVDVSGLEQLRKMLGDRVKAIFVMGDKEVIIERIITQGGDAENLKRRFDYAENSGEFNNWRLANYVVKNTNCLDDAVRQILAILGLAVPAK